MTARHPPGWSSPQTVLAAVRAKWDRGAVLRELHLPAEQRTTFPLRVRLPGPDAADLAPRFADVSTWAREMHDAATRDGWQLLTRAVRAGGLGTQNLPAAALIDTPHTALRLLGSTYTTSAARFAVALEQAAALGDAVAALALARPLEVLGAGEDWPLLLELAAWTRAHPRPNLYVRQIPVAGVHTKLVETHRPLLSRLLDAVLPADAVESATPAFPARFGFRAPSRRARVRGAAAVLGVPGAEVADVTWDVGGLAALDVTAAGVTELLIVENQSSYLTVPADRRRLVLWGAGYGAEELLAALPWAGQVTVRYWGDLDTHGFAILSRVRAVAPHTTSLLMDAATLLSHKPFWSVEGTPHNQPLPHLTDEEHATFDALRRGTYGMGVRLEQELIRFDLVERALGSGKDG